MLHLSHLLLLLPLSSTHLHLHGATLEGLLFSIRLLLLTVCFCSSACESREVLTLLCQGKMWDLHTLIHMPRLSFSHPCFCACYPLWHFGAPYNPPEIGSLILSYFANKPLSLFHLTLSCRSLIVSRLGRLWQAQFCSRPYSWWCGC